jgi:propanediol dehydratase large subunit
MTQSRRFSALAERDINQETFVDPWPEAGLTVVDSPYDPQPSLQIEDGEVVEMDGRRREEFDAIDLFIAAHALDRSVAEAAMLVPSLTLARMLTDVNVPQGEVRQLIAGCTPAKLVEIVRHMNVLEMMMGLAKMRVRRTPANQAHVTNWKEHPALLAADAAEAALRGFAEAETTVRVARNAPFNALAILVGTQTGRGGVLTQCAVEEALGLKLAMKGLVSYAETLSVYGTESTFVDGDDTPWSKAFLASAYASRGVKVRFTSGTGSEALMGNAEQCSMLYLEARCLLVTKGAGSQGVQNGSISCIALPEALPGGVRAVLAENLLASMLGLEVASGNDALASHSEIRKTAKLMLQFLPGTDFIHSGFSVMPKSDNLFGGGNFDAEDLDDYNVLQRDMQVDAGLRPISEQEATAIRRKGALAIQAVYAELGFPAISDEEIETAVMAFSSEDMADRDLVTDLEAADRFLESDLTMIDVAAALQKHGFEDVAANVLEMGRQRLAADYLQPSAIFDGDFHVLSAINDVNDYTGPGTGYRVEGERWAEIQAIPQAKEPYDFIDENIGTPSEKLIALGPYATARATRFSLPSARLQRHADPHHRRPQPRGCAHRHPHRRGQGGHDRTHDQGAPHLGLCGHRLHRRAGQRVGHCHRAAIAGHSGYPQAWAGPTQQPGALPPVAQPDPGDLRGHRPQRRPLCPGPPTKPVAVKIDNGARLRLIVKTTLLHQRETAAIEDKPPTEMFFDWEPDF